MSEKYSRLTRIIVSALLATALFPTPSIAFASSFSANGSDYQATNSATNLEGLNPSKSDVIDIPQTDGVVNDGESDSSDKEDVIDVESSDEVSDEVSDESNQDSDASSEIENLGEIVEPEIEPTFSALATPNDPMRVNAQVVMDDTYFLASAEGGHFENTDRVKFAVWSIDKDQDDLVWYDVPRLSNGLWAMHAPISNHRSTGEYVIHAYVFNGKSFMYAAAGSFYVNTPFASNTRLFQLSASQGTFTAYIDNVGGAPIRRVRVAVWAAENGQDDLRWYDTVIIGGSYTFGAYMSNHRFQTGLYVADAYVTLASGLEVFVGRAHANLEISGGSLSYYNDGDRSVTISCRDGIYGMASGVTYAVWSVEGGQDDLRWYRAYQQPDRSWPIAVPISNHRTAGTYAVHVYGNFPNGFNFIGQTSFYIRPNTATSVTTSLHDDTRGSFLVTVSGINAPTGVSRVLIPTWTKSGQSDIQWYQAHRQSNGDYTLAIAASNHLLANYYNIHAYVESGNGLMNYVGQASGNKLNLVHYSYIDGAQGSGYRNLWMKNPPHAYVEVYVWSAANGQDDLHRYEASYMGDVAWKATIDGSNLRHSGLVYVHIYAGGTFWRALSFEATDSDITSSAQSMMNARVNGLSSPTGWLIAVDTNNFLVTVYNGGQGRWSRANSFACSVGKPSSPTRTGLFSVGAKGFVFGHGYSCYYYTQYSGPYLFHSILYNPGTLDVQDGTMCGRVSNGCIRLYIENAKYIQDCVPAGSTVLVY